MKKFFMFALAAVTMVSCTNDEFLGEGQGQSFEEGQSGAILFGTGTNKTIKGIKRKADKTGADAATLLGSNFVVEGVKGPGTTYTEVFDHYNVNYKAGTANSTESNKKDWEYVGFGAHELSALNPLSQPQTIKYWDFSQAQYDFVAFSYGEVAHADATLTEIDYTKLGQPTTGTPVYTVAGSVADLTGVYAADLVTVKKANYTTAIVTPKFRRIGAKVRIGFYETIPGYSVKDVTFYSTDDRTAAAKPTLYAADKVIPSGDGTIKVYYPTINNSTSTDNNKVHVVFTADDDDTDLSSTLTFTNGLQYGGIESSENATYGTQYLGRQSNMASYATATDAAGAYEYVLPYGEGNDLKLRVDYTLVPIDGTKETITVKNATALVPAVYTAWEPNYAYTYLFKISMNTNGTTGTIDTDPAGLYPITFDAVVMNDLADGILETVTTVAEPSITTYAKGVDPTAAPEYTHGKNIYVSVEGATLTDADIQLYTASIDPLALQNINEVTVANAIVNDQDGVAGSPYVVTDAAGKALTVTDATESITVVATIPAGDSYTGNAISGNFAKFTPASAGTYVFEYTDGSSVKHYKVIIVK